MTEVREKILINKSVDTLEKTFLEQKADVDELLHRINTDDGDHDKFQHYFKKKDIEDNIFDGKPMKALCGKIVLQQVDPEGRTVCGTCKDELDRLISEAPDD